MENIILIVIAAFTLIFIWLMWLRYSLVHVLNQAERQRAILQADLSKRRDITPYLLESCRTEADPGMWQKLLTARAEFHKEMPFAAEWEFEKLLLRFIQETKVTSVGYLEAKKDILEMATLIEKGKQGMTNAVDEFNAKRKQFPYSLASAIFGLKAISV